MASTAATGEATTVASTATTCETTTVASTATTGETTTVASTAATGEATTLGTATTGEATTVASTATTGETTTAATAAAFPCNSTGRDEGDANCRHSGKKKSGFSGHGTTPRIGIAPRKFNTTHAKLFARATLASGLFMC